MIFRPYKAIDCFERVLRLTRELPDACLELAVLYERRHRVDEAWALIEACLRADAEYHEAQLFQARLLRRLKDEAGAEALFRQLTVRAQAHPLVRAQAWAELAQFHDRREEFPAAFAAMTASKQILLQHEGQLHQESEPVLRQLGALAESLTPAHFQRWAQSRFTGSLPRTAVLASFPRSGTTLLEQLLDTH